MMLSETIQENEGAMVESCEPDCALSVVYEGATEGTAVHPPDLSLQGMFINTPEHFFAGTILNLNFRLVGSGLELHARGEVRHCVPGVGVGVEFVELSREASRAIEEEIKVTNSMLPGRRWK